MTESISDGSANLNLPYPRVLRDSDRIAIFMAHWTFGYFLFQPGMAAAKTPLEAIIFALSPAFFVWLWLPPTISKWHDAHRLLTFIGFMGAAYAILRSTLPHALSGPISLLATGFAVWAETVIDRHVAEDAAADLAGRPEEQP
jgi:hypothetical protein